MAQAGGKNEGQAQHAASKQCVGREAESGGEKIFYHCELGKRIGSEKVRIELQIVGGGFQVGRGQILVGGQEISGGGDIADFSLLHLVGGGRQGQAACGVVNAPLG